MKKNGRNSEMGILFFIKIKTPNWISQKKKKFFCSKIKNEKRKKKKKKRKMTIKEKKSGTFIKIKWYAKKLLKNLQFK